jgi:hypothetical protein
MRLRSFLFLLAGALLASCGNDSTTGPQSPATIQGTVNATGGLAALSGPRPAASNAGIKVSIMGTNLSATTDASGRFVLSGITTDHVTLHFQASGIDATLDINGIVPGQTLTISVRVAGNKAEIDDDDPNTNPVAHQCFAVGQKAEVEGDISVKGVSDITVAQQGKGDYDCQLTATTQIRHGNKTLTLADLKIGDHVHVSGSGLASAGATCRVSADEIKLQ